MKNRKVLFAAVAVCLVAILACGSLAYFTTHEVATNQFMVAGYDPEDTKDPEGDDIFDVDVVEDLPDDSTATWHAEPADPTETSDYHGIKYEDIQPGDTLPKNPTIVNRGQYNMFVRVKVTVTKANEWLSIAAANGIKDLTTIFGGFDASKWVLACAPENDAEANTLTYTYYLGTKSGETYTGTELAKGETATLFETVTIPASLTADQFATVADFSISVAADAIQTANMSGIVEAFKIFDNGGKPIESTVEVTTKN